MGTQIGVGVDTFPQQGSYLNKRVKVCFNYDTSKTLEGAIVRDDSEEPFVGIVKLDDGRYLLLTECQYQPL